MSPSQELKLEKRGAADRSPPAASPAMLAAAVPPGATTTISTPARAVKKMKRSGPSPDMEINPKKTLFVACLAIKPLVRNC